MIKSCRSGCILSHIKRQDILDMISLFHPHRFKPHILADKMPEFIGGNFTQSFEPGDFRICSQFFYGRFFLFA